MLDWNRKSAYRENSLVLRTLDTHTAGEPLRIVIDGIPELPGTTILERRRYMQQHSKGQHTPVNLDTPAGLVRATAHLDARGHVASVSFLNVPSFPYARIQLDVPLYGFLTVDIAYGGAFYVVVPSNAVGLRVNPTSVTQLIQAGEAIKRAVNAHMQVTHPIEEDLSFVYGTIFTDQPEEASHHSRNVCIFADGEVDRSPTGTGVSARLALHYAKGEIAIEQLITIESLLGAASAFRGRVVEQAKVGNFDAVVPEVSGTAFITGRHEFMLDPRDELGQGFLLR